MGIFFDDWAEEFRKKNEVTPGKGKPAVMQSSQLKDVLNALAHYELGHSSEGSLLRLRVAITTWKEKQPAEFKNCGGDALLYSVDRERLETGKLKEPTHLENGDVLFRYVPPGIGQRDGMTKAIVVGQFFQELMRVGLLQGGNTAWSSWLVQHVGIYCNFKGFEDTVVEIDGSGLHHAPMKDRGSEKGRGNELDLVVRCDDKDQANRVALLAKEVKPQPWIGVVDEKSPKVVLDITSEDLNIHKEIKIPRVPQLGQDDKGPNNPLARYPLQDLLKLMAAPFGDGFLGTRAGVLKGSTMKLLADEKHFIVKKHLDENQLMQSVVCSHFVHAVLWTVADPHVTIRTATWHSNDHTFKISPAELWTLFINKQGVWKPIPASFKGIQQEGELYEMDKSELKNLKLAA